MSLGIRGHALVSGSAVGENVTIDIGGTPIALRTSDPAFRALLEKRYPGFLRAGADTKYALDIELFPNDGPVTDEPELHVSHGSAGWRLMRGDFHAQWDDQRGQGKILQRLSPYAIDSVLRIVHSLIQAPQGGFLLHGASAIRNGRAFLFSGVSGAGKTTISRLAPPDATLLTDEISYIRRDGDGYQACGTPFAGELARVGENCRAPIEHLFFLTQGPENRIDPIPASDALRMLLRNILFFADDSDLVEMVFRSACEFLGRVPASRLTFLPDERVWELIQ
jgi:hypothetical protein